MNQKTLNDLIGIHNILYKFPVAGSTVIPMAQILMTLKHIIEENASNVSSDNTVELGE